MLSIHLSKRLQTVLQFVPKGSLLADIGSDHAHLPCRAVLDHKVPLAIAGEVRRGPYLQAAANVRVFELAEEIDVRLGDGLDVLENGEADVIVISGMGGELIAEILERGKEKLTDDTTLILQPNIRESLCRSWLIDNGWRIENEAIVEEAPHFYEIIRAVKEKSGRKALLSESEIMMGPILLHEKTEIFKKKWQRRETKLLEILQALKQTSETRDILKKRGESRRQLQVIRQALYGVNE
ncbi:MAG: class I SAM-dependent methyltransferase [Sporolactobacillus sp.]